MAHTHTHNHSHTHQKLGWTIILNIIITITEYIGGYLSGSLALISDASHNLSDVLSLMLGYVGEKISHKKADDKHTYGFKRFELITAIINSITLLGIGFYIVFESFHRMSNPMPISVGMMVGVGFVGLVGNFLSIVILNKEKSKNLNMKAAYLHLFYDTLSSVFVIVSGVVIYFTQFYLLDVIVSFVIAIMIFWNGFGILKESFHLIMQGVPEDINSLEVYNAIKKTKGVKDLHNFHIWGINSNENFLSCHVCVDTKNKVKTDELLTLLNEMLSKKFNIKNTSIQLETKNLCNIK